MYLYNNQDYSHTLPISEEELSDFEVIEKIKDLKSKLSKQLVILGHHYQSDEIIQFSDFRGDSLALAQIAKNLQDKKYIVFCGVHFMAETADMLTSDEQKVILPDLQAGCSMADMANIEEIEDAWESISDGIKTIPITYINCSADLKSFVGKNGGIICTSSNAHKAIEWAFKKGKRIFFFPDQHLGRNTSYELGVSLEDMTIYDPRRKNGGLNKEKLQNKKVILWYGYCSVHQGFKKEHIDSIKKRSSDTKIIVHPECSFDVVSNSDLVGSTKYIIEQITKAPNGSKFAVGTEINLVNRLKNQFPNKEIESLSPYQCLCATMYRVRPRWLLKSLESIEEERPINVITVPKIIQKESLKALDRMLSL